MKSVRLATCVFALTVMAWQASSASASDLAYLEGQLGSTYYVSTGGSDSNPGTLSAPLRTVGHAASQAGAGSTVLIEGGNYAEDVKLEVSGAAGSPIVFEADGSEAVSVRSFNVAASHVAIENLTISGAAGNCVTIQPALSDITIKGDRIESCGQDGIHFTRPGDPPSTDYTSNSNIAGNTIARVGLANGYGNDMTIYANSLAVQHNDMTGTPNDAIDAWGDHLTIRLNNIHDIANYYGHSDAFQTWTGLNDGAEGNPVTNLFFARNRLANISGAKGHGLMASGPGHHDWTVRDNILQSIGGAGMILGITGSGSSLHNVDAYNNTFYNAGPGDDVEFNSQDTGLFADNILDGGGGLYITSGTNITEDYNLFYGTSLNIKSAAHDIYANPDFVDAAGGDFHLTSESPAIDAGDDETIMDPSRPYDYEGNPGVAGSLVDIGAYEYQSGSTSEGSGSEGSSSGGSSGPSYFVSTGGSDSNPGTLAAPWRTIGHAASTAGASATVLIEGGSYGEDVKLALSGAAGSPIVFEANGSETVSVRSFNVAASHVAVENLTISGASSNCVTIQPALTDVTIEGDQINDCGADGIHFVRPGDPPSSDYTANSLIAENAISGVGRSDSEANDITIYANYLTVEGNDMTGTPNDAMDAWGDHLTIRRNSIHDISNLVGNHNDAFQTWTGLYDGAEGNPVTNLLFEQNRIANVTGPNAHAFMLEGPGHHDWTVRDNIFQNIGSIGMILGITGSGSSSQNLDVYNNTFYNAGPGDDVEFNSQDTGLFADNIIQGGGGLYITSGTNITEDYNLFYGTLLNIKSAAHDIYTNPDFVDAAGGDLHLTLNSPAINAGDGATIVNPPRPYDYEGNPGVVGGLVDIGAYEHS
jgi:hypothetical protein